MFDIRNLKTTIIKSIFFKLFLFIFTISLVLFISLMYLSTKNLLNALERQKYEDMTVIISRTDQYIELYAQSIKNMLLDLSEEEFVRGRDIDTEKAVNLLKKYANNHPEIISNIYVFYKNGRVLANNLAIYEIIGYEQPRNIAESITGPFEGIICTEPYYSKMSMGTTIAFAKPVYEISGNMTAVMVAEINLDYLSNHLTNIIDNNAQSFVVISQQGEIIAARLNGLYKQNETGRDYTQYNNDLSQQLSILSRGVNHLIWEKTQVMAIVNDNNHLGWKLVVLAEKAIFFKSIAELYKKFTLIGLIYIVLIMFFSLLVSLNFSLPIIKLSNHMDNIKDVSFDIPKLPQRTDEIGNLTRSFEKMIDRIKELVENHRQTLEQKKQMELKILQKQIHPHFLGNTLACASSLAKLNQNDKVQEIIKSLILLINYGIDELDKMVPLKDEINFLDAYVHIQMIRSWSKFEFIVDIPQEHMYMMMPKLILQPIVENAIFHGLSEKNEKGRIVLHTQCMEKSLSIFISDNGLGMDEEKIRRILGYDKLQRAKEDCHEGRSHSIGIKNVNERIRLYFGDSYGVFITSEKNCGTCVEIRLPNQNPVC